jgi:hypothetical protein
MTTFFNNNLNKKIQEFDMRHAKILVGLSVATVLFLILAPIIPLTHSQPNNTPSPSWPNFYGSISRALLGFGISINGVGNVAFNAP